MPPARRRLACGTAAAIETASLGSRPWPLHLAYCASKAALGMATQCWRWLWPPDRVNAVAPGILDLGADELYGGFPPEVQDPRRAVGPSFLLAGAYTTGEVLPWTGARARLRIGIPFRGRTEEGAVPR
jgi:NAD(P)-dependent dehydrogenase (short-subunit alcohol dehydrogenase family)